MNGFDISTISGIYVGSTPYSAIYKGSTLVWSAGPHDYEKDYFTIKFGNTSNNRLSISVPANYDYPFTLYYQVSGDSTWREMSISNTTGSSVTVYSDYIDANKAIKLKANGRWSYTVSTNVTTPDHYVRFSLNKADIQCYGNINSLLKGDDFYNNYNIQSEDLKYCFSYLFAWSYATNLDFSNTIIPNYKFHITQSTECNQYRMFHYMFTSSYLKYPPTIKCTSTCYYVFSYMFDRCTSLIEAPELPAKTLTQYCYVGMFNGCTSLTTAPELPATTLVSNCYEEMFYGCSSLNYIKAMFTTTPSTSYTNNWVNGVASSGTFVKNPNATWDVTGNYGVPTNWISGTENQLSYLAIESLEDNNVIYWINNGTTNRTISWSTDKTNWTNVTASSSGNGTQITTLNTGDKIYFKGDNTSYGSDQEQSNHFNTTKKFNVSGNIMSLINSTSYQSLKTFSNSTAFNFEGLFMYSKVVDASSLYLPATTLMPYCYDCMFDNCLYLTAAPELPATTLVNTCYGAMFYECQSLTSAPELPATTLATNCYEYMFSGCSSLVNAPELPATTLATNCYNCMFERCTSLTTAPYLPARTLVTNCYNCMFNGCSSLKYIKAMFTTTPYTTYTNYWVEGVASSGTFIKSDSATWTTTGDNGVPSGWSTYKEKEELFTIISLSDNNTISVENTIENNITLYYNNGYKILSSGATTTIATLNKNDEMRIKTDLQSYSTSSTNYIKFKATGDFKVRGNIMSLLKSSSFSTLSSVSSYKFYNLFNYNTYLIDAYGLILPATSLGSYCYSYMFRGCSRLTKVPELPATSLTTACYMGMFYGCTSLTKAPELPATSLITACYMSMFNGCTSLTKAPELPATSMSSQCYQSMFYGCTSLTKAPVLPATTLAQYCYRYMFQSCTKLNYIKMLATNISASNCLYNWVYNVASTGTFVKNTSATWNVTGNDGIPTGWTVQTASS